MAMARLPRLGGREDDGVRRMPLDRVEQRAVRLAREVLGHLVARMEGPEPALRAALVGSQLVGLAVARYIVRVEPLANADPDAIVALVAPGLQRLLDLR